MTEESTRCLVLLSVPGTGARAARNIMWHKWEEALKFTETSYRKCDTAMGWGCLNQDWIEFEDDCITSWDWVKPLSLIGYWDGLYQDLEDGKIIMLIYYKVPNEGGGFDYVPHH